MQISRQAQAVLLLTVHFGKDREPAEKPLTTAEWARLAHWLKERDLQPAALMKGDPATTLSDLDDRTITAPRIRRLLERGGALGLSLERWERAGLWVLTRSDPEYPERLKRRLRQSAPAVLFGCGNRALLASGGVAVVGSRDASQRDVAYAQALGRDAALQGFSIVSGGARGVDQSAMLGALHANGTAIGVLPDSLLRSATSSAYRKHLMSNDLALVSPFSPEAGFSVGNAMARNRYIYCLSDAAIVVSCTQKKGGTWNGAIEDLKAGWVPLWVNQVAEPAAGNEDLVREGGRPLPQPLLHLSLLSTAGDVSLSPPTDAGLPVLAPGAAAAGSTGQQAAAGGLLAADDGMAAPDEKEVSPFYRLFLERMLAVTASRPATAKELAKRLALTSPQVATWLKRGVAEGVIAKRSRPVRYQRGSDGKGQPSLFDRE